MSFNQRERERRQRKRYEDRMRRRRVRQLDLPSDDVKPPKGGDWSRWEERARESLRASHRRNGMMEE
ncbi:hypothetical protein [Corynebacterium tuscaniense]|uniref:hypothetical protein n=1 Tax=Corynebacterium tuscaniense TaxID=302449 RepID=UPI0011AEE6B3|nr:hypothetical protein [Corynebacterium tuscaniense]